MSINEISDVGYEIEYNPETGYFEFDFGDGELAEEIVEQYESRPGLYEAIIDCVLFNDPTPTVNPENPSQVLVSDTQADDFKEVADEVLEA